MDNPNEMDRQDVHALLTDALRGVEGSQDLAKRVQSTRVKSRLLEAHPPEASADGIRSLLDELAAPSGFAVKGLSDGMWMLDSGKDVYFLDTLNTRFWLMHTTAKADRLQSLIAKAFLSNPRLDTAWMPAAQLDEIEGVRQWMKSSFAGDDLRPADDDEGAARRWRVQVEGADPQEILALVRRELPRYAVATALSAVGSRVHTPGFGGVYVVADYRGRFVSTGESFDLVAGVLWRTLDRYERFVRGLESRYRLGAVETDEGGLELRGDVAVIHLRQPIPDMNAFVSGLFTCREPFRLWAVPREVRPGAWVADAVDLHVGHTLRIEIDRDRLRLLLDERTCGNTVARMVANLQHRYDAQIALAVAA